MKKKMLDENLQKISEKADRCVTDQSMANVLLCYMLYRVEEPVDAELLYDIAVTGGLINYFTFQDAVQSLLDSGAVRIREDGDTKCYELTERGTESAKRLKTLAGKSYRDSIVLAAKRALRRRRNEEEVKISFEDIERGCYLHVRIVDHSLELLELRLYTPDRHQAQLLADKILANPSVAYHGILTAVLKTEEEPIDLRDN
ncbi:MAG: DUF4364 family protein [Oscillospiraceae bacterium]|nr:DUF4364 family protein [Oscillospiraceae bacterium]